MSILGVGQGLLSDDGDYHPAHMWWVKQTIPSAVGPRGTYANGGQTPILAHSLMVSADNMQNTIHEKGLEICEKLFMEATIH